jgi:hypothetical protein
MWCNRGFHSERTYGITQQRTNPEGQLCTPSGLKQGIGAYPPCPSGATAAQSSPTPPPCSRTVTDHCIQTYEGGRPR